MLPDTNFFERVNHHLGNLGQILQFFKEDIPELKEAFEHIVKAKTIITRYLNETNKNQSGRVPDSELPRANCRELE